MALAASHHSYEPENEDYIDMELTSPPNFFTHSIPVASPSPPHPRDFEFFPTSLERETTTSADQLFHNGILLPLHLPPSEEYYYFSTPLTSTTPATTTPFESCNASPSESCHVSRELNPDEYFSYYSSAGASSWVAGDNPNKGWSRKLKLIKHSSLTSKIKASRAYLKSLFIKSGCSDEAAGAIESNPDERSVSKSNRSSLNESRVLKKEERDGGYVGRHRRSFSGVMKRFSTMKSSSSSSSSSGSSSTSSSSSCNGFSESEFLSRSNRACSEIESSIQGAIAYCKRSQQQSHCKKTAGEVGFYSLSASIVCEDQERQERCRG